MNNQRVKTLYYRLIPAKNVNYKKAQPIFEDTDDFRMSIDDDNAIFEMKKCYATVDEARGIVDNYLYQWEILIGLEHAPDDLIFKFQRADIIDKQISTNDKHIINVDSAHHIIFSDEVTVNVSYGKYPNRPKFFSMSPDVRTMYFRYKEYKQGREPLTSMAYMCLTIFQTSVRELEGPKKKSNLREKAACCYKIDKKVLDKIGELTSKGNEKEARKFDTKNKGFIPLTPQEKEWIEKAVKILIRRAGEWAYDSTILQQITMDDLPNL